MTATEREQISIEHANAVALALKIKSLPARRSEMNDADLDHELTNLGQAATNHADRLERLLAEGKKDDGQ